MRELGLQLMSLRVVVSSTLLLFMLSGVAGAQDAPRWPDLLKKRNARYAVFDRADDARGDVHERDLLITPTRRVVDPVGDREEAFRGRMAAKTPPRASQHAVIRRVVDDPGDEREVLITRRPGATRDAETRRFRDFAGDQVELAKWKNDKLTAPGPDDRYEMVDQTGSESKRRYFDQREEVLHKDGASPRDQERDDERKADRDRDRQLMRDENLSERQRERLAERAAEKDSEKDADKAERDEEQAAEDADAAAERAAEQAAERTAERAAERADRDTDRQIQRQEDKPATGSSR